MNGYLTSGEIITNYIDKQFMQWTRILRIEHDKCEEVSVLGIPRNNIRRISHFPRSIGSRRQGIYV